MSQHPSPASRQEGLDALRGIAAVLVVMLHAGMPYLLQPMPGLAWPTRDAHPSAAVDGVLWAIEGFIMPLFLVLAGLFAGGLCRKLGPLDFVKHRTRRLLVPLLFGAAVIVPLDFGVWTLGFIGDGLCTWSNVRRMKFPGSIHRNLFGLSHLWFLEYLYLMCLGLASWVAIRRWKKSKAPGATGDTSAPTSLVVASSHKLAANSRLWFPTDGVLWIAPVACVLWYEPNVVVGFQHSFFPVIPKFLHAVVFFSMGLWLDGHPSRPARAARFGPAWLAVSAVAFLAMLPLIHRHQAAPLAGALRGALAVAAATFAVGASLGAYGIFLKVARCPRWLATLSEASFWIYLAHHPIVGLVEIDLARVNWPTELKFVAVTSLTLTLCVASYLTLVRGTWLGTLLHGRRKLPLETSPTATEAPTTRRAA